ncbi:glycoside hydrolase family 172 protein [Listeria ilorinensis]|uniref:glycoside hydrolase family 172 protein n=1 Tax=Listeria ilorinensis TaxID=2867439 RepID=UPI001EF5A135|nr:glycoside hydrolase family 172 protein [Listeria ilorinensis]
MSFSTLGQLPKLRASKRQRISSYDRKGGNFDWIEIPSGQTADIATIQGSGTIRHIWCTLTPRNDDFEAIFRKLVLKMYWDQEEHPSVLVPLGDFFGIGFGICKDFWSLPLTMSPQDGRSFNCFFAMPFGDGAKIELLNESDTTIHFYYYVDYEEVDVMEEDMGRFHACWHREKATTPYPPVSEEHEEKESWFNTPEGTKKLLDLWAKPNLDGKDNYTILEAEGRGHYVGCNLNIDCFKQEKNNWYGEGDDMIFIDGDPLPTIYGTGTEDYFNTAHCPTTEFSTPYFGITLHSGDAENPWRGKNSMYRFHIEDPIMFEKSIKVTIEHGHANKLGNDYSSTAYWYQTEPHKPFPELPPLADRLPRKD